MTILKKQKKNQMHENKIDTGKMILLAWTIVTIVCGIIINGININRLNIAWYILIIWNALGIYEIIKKDKYRKIFIASITFLYFINFAFFVSYYEKGTMQISNSFTFSNGLVDAIEYVDELNKSDKIILSYNVCNTDKEDVFIRYATNANQLEKYIVRTEFLKYYMPKEKVSMNFSTRKKEYIVQNIDYATRLIEKVYILEKNEYIVLKENLKKYEVRIFNDYVVLMKEE